MTERKRKRRSNKLTYKLVHGGNDPEIINMLISLTKMNSEEMCKALHYYFVDGFEESDIVGMTSVTKSNLCRDIAKINDINHIFEKIKERDYYNIRAKNKRTQKSVK